MHRWVEHMSEEELEIEASSPEAVFAEAVAALGELLGTAADGEWEHRDVRAGARDLPSLLVAWLEELVYLAEVDGFIADELVELDLADTRLEARVSGRRASPQALVKGVTYSGLEMAKVGDRWRARVVLDV